MLKLLDFPESDDHAPELQPEPEVVRLLEEALELAQAGKITGFSFLGQTPSGEWMTSWAYPLPTALHEVLGQFELMKFQSWDSADGG